MDDVSKYLPLSQRRSGDESNVTGDWSARIATTLLAIAAVLDQLPADAWDGPGLRDGYTVRDGAGRLLWRLGTPRRVRAREVLRGVLDTRRSPRLVTLEFCRAAAAGDAAGAARGIRSLAGNISASTVRRSVGDLSVAVVEGYDLARSVGRALTVDPVTAGAVALARGLGAPTPVKAAMRGRMLVATDSELRIGRGRALAATTEDIVLFLWERAGVPGIAPAKPAGSGQAGSGQTDPRPKPTQGD